MAIIISAVPVLFSDAGEKPRHALDHLRLSKSLGINVKNPLTNCSWRRDLLLVKTVLWAIPSINIKIYVPRRFVKAF